MALCHPSNAIWPDPSVLIPDPDWDADQLLLFNEQIEIATGLAWSSLQVLSAYQIAICPITVRPCRKSCNPMPYLTAPVWYGYGGYSPFGSFFPYTLNGQWYNMTCGHRDPCSCTHIRQVELLGPVGDIVSVDIGGLALDPDAYRVDNSNMLVRQDGEQWPLCQDMNKPLGEEDTWSVTYFHGATADITVRYAAGIMADEYLKGILGADCRLPSGTVNIIRQNIAIEVEKDMFEHGLTGIPEVDAVTARFNPFRRKSGSAFYNPDKPVQRQTTWQA